MSLLTGVPLFAQSLVSPAIEQSRLLSPNGTATPAATITADGTALPQSDSSDPDDGSFGSQQILKSQPKVLAFTLSSDASIFYTSNVALTDKGTIADAFLVVNAGLSYEHAITPELGFQIGARSSVFRYNATHALDFEGVGGGLGLQWSPAWAQQIAFTARYDFSELIDSHGHEILSDHEFLVGAQRVFVLGRAHAFSIGVIGSAGVTTPSSSEREQLALNLAYRIQLTRKLGADIGYRLSGLLYAQGGRRDFNQFLNLSLNYQLTRFAGVGAFWSLGKNDSNVDAFSYEVFTGGGGLSFNVKF